MSSVTSIRVGVVALHERIGHPWQEFAWRPAEVVFPAPADDRRTLMRETQDGACYFLGTTDIDLHRSEASGYLDNLATGSPSLYVVLRHLADAEPPLELCLVTASPTEVQAYGEGGDEILGPVAMPTGVAHLVGMFAAQHDTAETFLKRSRQGFAKRDDHQFGQEPIVEVRARKHRATKRGGS